MSITHIKRSVENLGRRKILTTSPNFSDSDIKHFGFFPTTVPQWQYLNRNPNFIDLNNIPKYSDHVVNTERVANADKAMYHVEGGKNHKKTLKKANFLRLGRRNRPY